MIKSAVTISLVDEARGGPFVFWDDLEASARKAAELGFEAIEIFAPGVEVVDVDHLRQLTNELNIGVAGFGTGAGWVVRKLSLVDPDPSQREKAMQFIQSIIELGAAFGAPAVIGSMQGRWNESIDRTTALEYLGEALNKLGEYARQRGAPLIYEPLNRYETNLINTVAAGVELLKSLSTDNVKLLADLFHMNIEETNLADAIRAGKGYIGHVHFVDSTRQAAGRGHIDFQSIAHALREIHYDGYVSAEAFPIPDSAEAARLTIEAYRKYFS
jgi:sugar phosphate isomerase/epimerase